MVRKLNYTDEEYIHLAEILVKKGEGRVKIDKQIFKKCKNKFKDELNTKITENKDYISKLNDSIGVLKSKTVCPKKEEARQKILEILNIKFPTKRKKARDGVLSQVRKKRNADKKVKKTSVHN